MSVQSIGSELQDERLTRLKFLNAREVEVAVGQDVAGLGLRADHLLIGRFQRREIVFGHYRVVSSR